MKDTGLTLAITAAGSQRKLAAALGISQPAIAQWEHIPIERVAQVARLTGIPFHELRPDVFPDGIAHIGGGAA